MDRKVKVIFSYFIEFCKWGVVIYLLWPILAFQHQKMTITRLIFGVLLLVIFIGKLFYDILFSSIEKWSNRSNLKDLFSLVGVVTIIALLIGITIFFIGYYIFLTLQETNGG